MLAGLVRKLIYPRYVVGERAGPPPWPPLERHFLTTDQGDVEHWFVPARAGDAERRPVVLFSHGNGELIDDWPEALARYGDMGVHLALVEFRGYGDSAGEPTEARLVEDFLRVTAEVRKRSEVDPRQVLYHGRSLGGGVACAASRRVPPAALILQSTFVSMRAMGKRFGAPGFVMPDRYDNLAALRQLQAPCLIMHGDADELVPLEHGRALAAANPRAKLHVMPGADHNAPVHLHPDYWQQIGEVLRELDAWPHPPVTLGHE